MLFIIEIFLSFVAIIVALVSLVFRQLTEKFDYWTEKNIPSASVFPFFGSYKDVFLLKSSISQLTWDLYTKYSNEKFVGAFRWNKPELIIRDPNLIQRILIEDFEYFQARGFCKNENNELISRHLYVSNGQKWNDLRKNISSTFSPNILENMLPLLVECGEEFQFYVKTMIDGGHELEIRELMTNYTLSVIGSCAFGINPKIISAEKERFKKISKAFSKPSFLYSIKALILECIPKVFNFFNLRMVEKESEEFFLRHVTTLMQKRHYKPSIRHDYIDALLELKLKSSMVEDEIEQTNANAMFTAQAFAFLDIGFDTISSTLGFALYEIAVNRDVQKMLLKEMDAVLSKYNNKISYQTVCEMPYLDMVIDETLRKYPPIGTLRRICKKQYEIPTSSVVLDEGVSVLISVFGLHYDSKYFFEPELFKPDRFSSEKKRLIPPCVYLPFGEGPRNCIGFQFAKLQIKVGLISLLNKYSIETSVKTKYDIEYDPASFVTKSSNGIWLRLQVKNK